MRLVAATLLLSACASQGSGNYLLITDAHHGPLIWHKFKTQEACHAASRESDPSLATRCIAAKKARARVGL
jgi:hypothetical protein